VKTEKYSIYCGNKLLFSDLTQGEYFNIMEDLSVEYYQTGSPRPEELRTEIVQVTEN